MDVKCKVLVTRHIPYVLEQLAKNPSLVVDCYEHADVAIPPAELVARAAGCTGILCMITDKITPQVLDSAGPSLKVVSTISAGFDHIDVAACRARGVAVGHTPGCLHVSTAELAVSLTFAIKRRLLESHKSAIAGEWGVIQVYQFCGSDVSGCTVGVVGLGEIGIAYARMLQNGFGCRILYSGPREKTAADLGDLRATFVDLPTLLSESDVVSLHCPLTPATPRRRSHQHGTRDVVDQDALVAALQSKPIAAALDVTSPEPLPPAHPLFHLPNCIVVPHIASATLRTRHAMCDRGLANVLAGVASRPLPTPVP
ncbi:hypothetical protein SPRG_06212 [Saprolegnia parasitica CBS 223.65]|uniref:D-isomer specific 2-hydroxyacid dehydrogenase NAD-binding domain-containing protein n=1 Tax=Saprolegnia parasitica (strain CBS 223.65) TaxID=695850 RepID=A0A067CG95_SAPPC|nr:hypothetical protein SPRG_06212 [Saprolegnia parasitica CBS 223.65]KDO28165.1 hypothetical protein SPRG_06212 [Saprolegnia parasitica CBS 223.65]|eukprot:XP_012200992.1 hypothetical protein SPRG_06212 [Saprolegnia parasitica CBS 223.65]